MPADPRELARRIGDRERHRDPSVRAVALAGDYAAGRPWEASILQIILFPDLPAAPVQFGPLALEDGIRTAVDRIPVGLISGPDDLPDDPALLDLLASLELLRVTGPGLREILLLLRDRRHSADGRADRSRRSLQAARVALDDFDATGLPVHAFEAAAIHAPSALAARLGEPHDPLRLPRRLRSWSRILKQPDLASAFAAATGIDQRTPDDSRSALAALHSLAESHLHARLPEAGVALLPRIERICEPALAAADALEARGDQPGAVWAFACAALGLDRLIDAASPWRERADYRQRASAAFGVPDPADLRAFIRIVREVAD